MILFAARGGANPNPAIRASTGRCAQNDRFFCTRLGCSVNTSGTSAILGAVALGAGRRAGWHWSESMHAHSNPAGQGPLGFESTKTRTAQPCNKKPRVIRPRATGTSAIIVTIEGKARAGVAARRVRASGALPTGDVDGDAPRRPRGQVARLQRETALGVRARSGTETGRHRPIILCILLFNSDTGSVS